MTPKSNPLSLAAAAFALLAFATPASAQLIRSAAGSTAADIQIAVDVFRNDLGALNPNLSGSFGTGRREINWDGVPDGFAAPNNLPPNFFNVNSPRGVLLSTPGAGFQVSGTAGVAPVDFGNIDPNYPQYFAPFSPQRMFTPIGSNITDVTFVVAGGATPALTRGFGSVFSDVDLANVTSIQLFGADNSSLGTFFAPPSGGNEGFSFLGISYLTPMISRVRITTGNQALASGAFTLDTVVMDDWIYGEPVVAAVATPDGGSTVLLLGAGLAALLGMRRWRSR